MPVTISHEEEVMTAVLSGEIDHHTARYLREQVDEHLERMHPKHMILDFSDVSFMDSSGIGLIMGRYRLMSEFGGTLELSGMARNIARMIRLAGIGRLGITGI